MNKKQIIGLIISIAILVAVFFLPIPQGLTDKGLITIGLLLFFLIMLITEALPVGVICFLCLALLPILGVTKNLTAGLNWIYQHDLIFCIGIIRTGRGGDVNADCPTDFACSA